MYTNGQIQAAVFSIQKGIPVPPARGRLHGSKYPLAALEIGDSFAAPTANQESGQKLATYICNAANRIAGKKFTTRRLIEDGQHVVRVWRTA